MSDAHQSSAIRSVFGSEEDAVSCRSFDDAISIHWWPAVADVGDPCICGEMRRTRPIT